MFGLDLPDEPCHEFRRYKLHHVAAETVNSLRSPEINDIEHPVPSGCVRVTIVYLHGLVPVVYSWLRTVAVVACSHCRHLTIGLHALRARSRKLKLLAWIVEEVVFGCPMH